MKNVIYLRPAKKDVIDVQKDLPINAQNVKMATIRRIHLALIHPKNISNVSIKPHVKVQPHMPMMTVLKLVVCSLWKIMKEYA
jgi:hypothetical protein